MNENQTPSGSLYGEHLPEMEAILAELTAWIEQLRSHTKRETGDDPVEHVLGRIKTEESMRDKCRRRGIPETTESALNEVHDAIGVRAVCAFLSDVYTVRDHVAAFPGAEIVKEKDYIRHAKKNGYRSYHMILKIRGKYFAEVQIRTISMDTWAALEHHLKYKRDAVKNEALIVGELKRCADELASTDISMQTIRDMIFEEA